MNVRNAHINIAEFEDTNGNIVAEQNHIAYLLVTHFKKKFEHHDVSFEESLFDTIPKVIIDENNALMDALPSAQEIKDAVFSMDPNSSLGPDGFPARSFHKRRNIQEKIVLSSELVNELNTKRRGGNVGLKLDITQAFDSMSWEFIFETLKHFGFSQVGINWLRIIFESARISVLVNGGPFGFFEVRRGLRQGYPLSPILFVIAEEVLSRNLTKMIQEGLIQTMVNKNGCKPSHLMFADDIFLFCNGHKRTLDNLMGFIMKYQSAPGQTANRAKSKCFVGGVTEERRYIIAKRLQMELSGFLDKYLGVILCPGRKLITVKWDEVNSHFVEGGLDIRRWEVVNKALLLKLLWKIETEDEEWTRFMKEKYKNKNGDWITGYKKSSIWLELKWVMSKLNEGSRWLVRNERNISVWQDKWVKENALINQHYSDPFVQQHKNLKSK
ncbi:uncharacterized protein LOC113294270 [Papaver somniferum]|uniref:uncharacterized protein LOC113294270 n=1 Tax=Papaver somniferum TaxID=3469 RepID=UPI000E6FB232|nr:uncharacterized protein LOC113294270 [Papaver somniferum]